MIDPAVTFADPVLSELNAVGWAVPCLFELEPASAGRSGHQCIAAHCAHASVDNGS